MASVVSNNLSTYGTYLLKNCSSVISKCGILPAQQQVRCLQHWPDWRMKKDVRKRQNVTDYAELKLRFRALRRNSIVPSEIQKIAREEMISQLPNDALGIKITNRCALTSRPRGTVFRWRLSRIMFRHFADYNKLAGVMRAMW